MSTCPPSEYLGNAPDFVPVMYGTTSFWSGGGVIGDGSSAGGEDESLKIMWEEGCEGGYARNLSYDEWPEEIHDNLPPEISEALNLGMPDLGFGGNLGGQIPGFEIGQIMDLPGHPKIVECKIPDQETWDGIWESAAAKGVKPYEFLEDPIGWIKYELGNLVGKSIGWWTEVQDPFAGNQMKSGARGPNTAGPPIPRGTDPEDLPESVDEPVTSVSDYPVGDSIYDAILDSTLFLTGVVAVISLLFVAGRMALQRDAKPAREVVRAMLTLVVVTGVGLLFTKILLRASDAFGDYFIVNTLQANTNGDSPCDILDQHIAQVPIEFENMNFFLFLVCAALFLIGSVILYLIMIARILVVTLVAALLPLSAASTATTAGKAWFGNQIALLLSFILMKPCAVIIFVTSLRFADRANGNGMMDQVTAAAFLAMGTILLPALTRLVFPFTASAAQGEGTAKALMPRVPATSFARGAIRKMRSGGD